MHAVVERLFRPRACTSGAQSTNRRHGPDYTSLLTVLRYVMSEHRIAWVGAPSEKTSEPAGSRPKVMQQHSVKAAMTVAQVPPYR